jgi:hypothetical protein
MDTNTNINKNINNQDVYYNKYIKYKTKYLELKEQNGSALFGLFSSNKDIYGRYYDEFVLKINEIKIIKEIKEVIGPDRIKEMMKINLETPNISIFFEFQDHYKKSLEKYFEDKNKDKNKDKDKKKIIQIIKKSNNKKIIDIINVLEDIENILIFNTSPELILPELYVNFSEKLDTFKNKQIEEYKKKKKIKIQLTKIEELKLELELGIKENDDYKQNIESIKNIYFIFCDIKNGYQKYYNNFYSNIKNYNDYYSQKINNQQLKNTINIKNEEYKTNLKMYLNIIKPKVPLLLEAIDLYFHFLKYYIDNDIKPYTDFTDTSIINQPFRSDPYIRDQESFIFNIGTKENLTRGKMINKIFERYLYSDKYLYCDKYLNSIEYLLSDTILNLFNQINSLTNSKNLSDFEFIKNQLKNLLDSTKKNLLLLTSKNNKIMGNFQNFIKKFGSEDEKKNPIDKIIIIIENNYNDIESNKSNNGFAWEMYHEKYQNKINDLLMYGDFNFPLLKKCINIYLYKIFDYISSKKS